MPPAARSRRGSARRIQVEHVCTLDIPTDLPLAIFAQRAAIGLRSVCDEGEEVIAALERAGRIRAPMTVRTTPVTPLVAQCGGNVSAAARILGCSRSTVRARLAREAASPANDNSVRRAG